MYIYIGIKSQSFKLNTYAQLSLILENNIYEQFLHNLCMHMYMIYQKISFYLSILKINYFVKYFLNAYYIVFIYSLGLNYNKLQYVHQIDMIFKFNKLIR